MMRLAILSSVDELQQIEPVWNALVARLDNPCFQHSWFWLYALKASLLVERAELFCVYDGEQLVFACPFVIKRYRFSQLYFAESIRSRYVDLADALIDSRRSEIDFFQFIQQQFYELRGIRLHSFRFTKVREDSLVLEATKAYKRSLRPQSGNSFFDCRSEAGITSLSKKNLRNIKRHSTKLATAHGDVAFAHYTNASDIERFLPIFIELENLGWKGDSQLASSIKRDSKLNRFVETLAQVGKEDQRFCVNVLTVDNQPIAGQIAFKEDKTWFIYKIAYMPEFAHYGPGNILLHEFLKFAMADADIDEINLITAPEWASRWQGGYRNVYHLVVFAQTGPGRFLNYYNQGYNRMKATAKACINRL